MVEQEPKGSDIEFRPGWAPKHLAELALYAESAALTLMATESPDIETRIKLGMLAVFGVLGALASRKTDTPKKD